jgi:hypothetical protein
MGGGAMKRLSARRRLTILILAATLLDGCSGSPTQSRLTANAIACRSRAAVTELRSSGERYQRVADDHLASGRCRVFRAGQAIEARFDDHGLLRFVDPATTTTYWSDGPG